MYMKSSLKLTLILAFSLLLYTGFARLDLPELLQGEVPMVAAPPVMPEAVVLHLKELSELSSAQTSVQTVVISEDTTEFLGIPFGSTKLLYIALGEVRAGIDLSEMNVNRVSISNTVNVSLPQARILDTKIDINRSFVYDVRKSALFAPDELPLHSAAQREAFKRIEKAALETGLLGLANKNAARIVKEIVEEIVDKEVLIVFE